jgi:hypothetical protein
VAVAGAQTVAEAAQKAVVSGQAATFAASGSHADAEEDMLMLEEDELDFVGGGQPTDAHQHAVHIVKRLGEQGLCSARA